MDPQLTGVKVSQCHKCFKGFGSDDEKYSYYECDHSVCLSCFGKLLAKKEYKRNCNICGCESLFPLESGVPDTVHVEYSTPIGYTRRPLYSRRDDRPHMVPTKSLLDAPRDSKIHPDNTVSYSDEWGNAVEKRFEMMLRKLKEPLHMDCSKCEIRAEEKDLYICETCYEEEEVDAEADIENHVICANCTIRNHIRDGHTILDLSEFKKKFSDAHDEMKLKLDIFEADQLECTVALTEFFSLVEVLRTKNEELLNQARRSRTTNSMVNTFEKINIFMEKSKNVMSKASSELAKHAEDFLFQT